MFRLANTKIRWSAKIWECGLCFVVFLWVGTLFASTNNYPESKYPETSYPEINDPEIWYCGDSLIELSKQDSISWCDQYTVFSVVRIENADSTQCLWSFAENDTITAAVLTDGFYSSTAGVLHSSMPRDFFKWCIYAYHQNKDPFFYDGNLSGQTETADIDGRQCGEIDYHCEPVLLNTLDVLVPKDMLLSSMAANEQVNGTEQDIFYYHGDHLGSAHWITDFSGVPVQYIHYAPYGELIENQTSAGYDERYKFTGKERDEESGYDYFGARFYSSPLSFWLSVDPLAGKYPNISPYAYCGWNPVKYVDPNGKWIAVTCNADTRASYTVIGGVVDMDDRNIYVVGNGYDVGKEGKPKDATILAQTATPYSFSNENGKVISGSTIDMTDKSGDSFLSQFQNNEISLLRYVFENPNREGNQSGRNKGNCDFKYGGDVNRGMPLSLLGGKIGTARDVGNFAAGYLAARKGIPYGLTMWAFDKYQNYTSGTAGEPPVSRWAQLIGFGIGINARQASRFNQPNIYNTYR